MEIMGFFTSVKEPEEGSVAAWYASGEGVALDGLSVLCSAELLGAIAALELLRR